jgi:two-component system, response regulator PdtaR
MKKIIVVEDDYILALVEVKFIERMGFEIVACVTNGPDAIDAVKEHSPDIIVMDVKIEGAMDGVETMLEIQKFSDIPVVYLTGNSESSVMERAKSTNVKGFFVKPVNYPELEMVLKKI